MSNYYNPNRAPAWNYSGPNWRLSRSKIDLFLQCPRCFYLDNKLGTKRPPGYPFNLNSAVDTLLKQEFDIHRAKGSQHPLQKKYKLDAVPAPHEKINLWRDNFKGVEYKHPATGMTVSGAIDDLWLNKKGEYIVVDYKATAKDTPVIELKEEWQDGYKRQMEIYQWLLRRNKLKVSNTGYFVYCTGKTDAKAFDGKIEFAVHLIPHTGSDKWIPKTLKDIKACLESKKIPEADLDCDYCNYVEARNKY